jgi:hypothetical protein
VSTALAVGLSLWAARPASAGPSLALDAHISSGVEQDLTVIGRLMAGGMLVFDPARFAIDAHLSFEGFLRVANDKGMSARSFGVGNLGFRYGFRNERFHGPYVAAGGGFGLISGKPRERKLADDTATCENANPPDDQCTFEIDKHVNGRLGFGWGFASGKRTTVGVRVDLMYWLFSVAEEQESGSPPARFVERPQDAWSVMIGLEFMRWR